MLWSNKKRNSIGNVFVNYDEPYQVRKAHEIAEPVNDGAGHKMTCPNEEEGGEDAKWIENMKLKCHWNNFRPVLRQMPTSLSDGDHLWRDVILG